MNKEDVLQFLKDNLYLVHEGNSNILTSKFFRDFGVATTDKLSKPPTSKLNISKEDYIQFIEDAEVPTFLSNGQGGRFYANRFSKKGFEAFKVASSKTDAKVLLAACKWYYKQNNTSKVMIGTWFEQDIWISCVQDIKKALEKQQSLPTGKEKGNSLRL